MNDIITNGTEIKQRIISEINSATQCIYLAMAWFTDRDIASVIIDAKSRNVLVDIVLSSNASNETVKLMLKGANINVHAFDTGDERGMMHHKFCLIDNKISINGSYNYSYNASNNNVENIQVSDDPNTYKQFYSEFERIRYNIDHNIDVNTIMPIENNVSQHKPPLNVIDTFSKQLNDLLYTSVQINTEEYKRKGYEKSKESEGNIELFKAEYNSLKEEIRVYATDESLGNKKNTLIANISNAFESNKEELDNEKVIEISRLKRDNELEKTQIISKLATIREDKLILEIGNQNSGEKGLLQINNEIEKCLHEKRVLEESFFVKKFWSAGNIFALIGLLIFIYYLSIFFASAMYKVFFEGNEIRAAREAGGTPPLPQLVDADAIIKIFNYHSVLFGIMAMLFFLIPVSLSNIKLIGSKNKLTNLVCFWVGVIVFDVLVSAMVAINTDEIKSLLNGNQSTMKIWEVVTHGEFWLIFVFGMLPLIITHFLINFLTKAYNQSQRDIVDAERSKKINILTAEIIDLNLKREYISTIVKEKDNAIKESNDKIMNLEQVSNNIQTEIENKYFEYLKKLKTVFDDFYMRIQSGRIFTDVILNSITSSYKAGFIDFLPEFYADAEVSNRVKEIERIISTPYHID